MYDPRNETELVNDHKTIDMFIISHMYIVCSGALIWDTPINHFRYY